MGKKLNIMAEVEQPIYDAVVVPHKQSRTFTTLIETLLNGYYRDAYIRSFVDDTLEGIQHESTDVLNDIISSMHMGLANMGVYTDELRETSQDGMNAFSKKSEEVKEELKDIQAQEIKDIKEGMEELREQVRTQNEEILSMLKTIMVSGGVAMNLEKGKEGCFDSFKVSELEETFEVKEEYSNEFSTSRVDVEVLDTLTERGSSPLINAVDMVSEESPTINGMISEETVGGEGESVTSEEEANEIMASLLVGQVYSF